MLVIVIKYVCSRGGYCSLSPELYYITRPQLNLKQQYGRGLGILPKVSLTVKDVSRLVSTERITACTKLVVLERRIAQTLLPLGAAAELLSLPLWRLCPHCA